MKKCAQGMPINNVGNSLPIPDGNSKKNLPVSMQTLQGNQYHMPRVNSSNLPFNVMPHNLHGNQNASMQDVNPQPSAIQNYNFGNGFVPVHNSQSNPTVGMQIRNFNWCSQMPSVNAQPNPVMVPVGNEEQFWKVPRSIYPKHPIDQLTVEEVAIFIRDLAEFYKWNQAEEYADSFKQNCVNGNEIVKMAIVMDIKYLGEKLKIERMGHCFDILLGVREVHTNKAYILMNQGDMNISDNAVGSSESCANNSVESSKSCPLRSQSHNKCRVKVSFSDSNDLISIHSSRSPSAKNYWKGATGHGKPIEETAFHRKSEPVRTFLTTNEIKDVSSSRANNSQQQRSYQEIKVDHLNKKDLLKDHPKLPQYTVTRGRKSWEVVPLKKVSMTADKFQQRAEELGE